MEVRIIQKYKNKSVAQLKKIAETHFNKYIRYRDTDSNGFGWCISSGQPLRVPSQNAQAGHFYSGGNYPELKFNEINVNLQGKSDNYFKSGNENEYRRNLIKKYGQEAVDNLDLISAQSKKQSYKWDRFYLIDIIETYKQKVKEISKTKNF